MAASQKTTLLRGKHTRSDTILYSHSAEKTHSSGLIESQFRLGARRSHPLWASAVYDQTGTGVGRTGTTRRVFGFTACRQPGLSIPTAQLRHRRRPDADDGTDTG